MRPVLRGLIAAVSLSLAPLAVVTSTATTAYAAADVATTATFNDGINKRGEFGDLFSFSGAVDAADGSFVGVGEVQLQAQAPGSSTWRTIGNDATPSFASYPNYDSYRSNTLLRLAYTGGVDGETTYLPSTSQAISIKVFRAVDFTPVSGKRQPTADVKVRPSYKNKTILIQKKQGKSFKPFRKIKTNAKSKVRFSVPGSSRGIDYRLVVPKDKNFIATQLRFTATQF